MINVIAIYHAPQECGEPYVAVVSQETGKIIDTITVPDSYYYSGCEMVKQLQPVRSFTEEICTTKVPTPESYIPKAQLGYPGRKYEYVVTKVDVTGEDWDIIHTYNCTVHVDACLCKEQWRYSRSLDTFRKKMEEQGIDMTGWCLYRRMRTPLDTFLRTVVTLRNPDYHLVNLIKIG